MSRNPHTHQYLILLSTLGQSLQIRSIHWKKVQQVCITLPPAALPRQQMLLTDFSLQKLKNQMPFLARDAFIFNSTQKGFQTFQELILRTSGFPALKSTSKMRIYYRKMTFSSIRYERYFLNIDRVRSRISLGLFDFIWKTFKGTWNNEV